MKLTKEQILAYHSGHGVLYRCQCKETGEYQDLPITLIDFEKDLITIGATDFDYPQLQDDFSIALPLLRNLSSLTKPITVEGYNEGKPFIPMIHLFNAKFDDHIVDDSKYYFEDFPNFISCSHSSTAYSIKIWKHNLDQLSIQHMNLMLSWGFNLFLQPGEFVEIKDVKNGYLNGRNNLDTHCDHCKLAVTPEGHDGCMGTLPYPVKNACCGHGEIKSAYVQLDHPEYKKNPNKCRLEGQDALDYIAKNKTY